MFRSLSTVLGGVVPFDLGKKRQAKMRFANWPVFVSTATPQLTNENVSNIYYIYRYNAFTSAVAWLCEDIHLHGRISADP